MSVLRSSEGKLVLENSFEIGELIESVGRNRPFFGLRINVGVVSPAFYSVLIFLKSMLDRFAIYLLKILFSTRVDKLESINPLKCNAGDYCYEVWRRLVELSLFLLSVL